MSVIDVGPGGANDINDAGQVVGESLVATGGKLPLAGAVLSRLPPDDRTPLGAHFAADDPTMPFKSIRSGSSRTYVLRRCPLVRIARKAPTRASLAKEVT
jgi:hypothetical protein